MMLDEKLSLHFTLREFLRSETAARLGIDNMPSRETLHALERTAGNLERVRQLLGVPIYVSSGYRCEALERVLCERDFIGWCRRHEKAPAEAWPEYFARKAHPTGRATDFEAPEYGPPIDICRAIYASDIDYDQLIYEHTWVHLAWARVGAAPRRQVLTLMPGGGYAAGIVHRPLS